MHTSRLKKLLRNINDEDASIRRSAVEGLAEGDDRAIYPLIKALRDDNFGVQDAAMRSLMELKNETTAYMVLPLLRENAFLRNTALIILTEMGKISVPLLYVLLNDRDDDVRKFALDLIHDIGFCNYPEKLVEMLTGDSNANVRASAAKTLGKLQYKKSIPQLMSALKDEEWVCFSALESLTEFRDEGSIDQIVTLLKNPSETTRFAAIEALGKICSPKATDYLIDHMSSAEEFEKRSVLKSLVQIGTVPPIQGLSEILLEMLDDDDWDEKFTAIKGLALLGDSKAIYSMIDLAGSLDPSDPENEDRIYMIKSAIQNFGCNKTLNTILNDNNVKFRSKVIAIETVGSLQCKDSVPALIDLLNSEYRDVRRSSIKSLGQIESEESTGSLIDAISDPDSHVRKTAVMALGQIGEMTAFDPLMKMLEKEEYSDVIDAFIMSLLNINSAKFKSKVKKLSKEIQEAASRYMADISPEVTC